MRLPMLRIVDLMRSLAPLRGVMSVSKESARPSVPCIYPATTHIRAPAWKAILNIISLSVRGHPVHVGQKHSRASTARRPQTTNTLRS